MTTIPALRMVDVTFRYLEKGKRNILDHVSMDISEGGITLLMGGSGCGKSTLAAVAAGLYPENGGWLEKGTILLFGKPLSEMNEQQRARLLTVMFQNPDLQFCMNTLRREMQFCMENLCIPPEDMGDRIEKAAERLGVEALLDRELFSLSGGEKQMAALSCLYVMESRCILLDECFANIDRSTAGKLMRLLVQIRDEGRTIIAIDHKADLWLEHAKEIVVLGEGGCIAARGIHKDNLDEYRSVFEEQGLFFPERPRRMIPLQRPAESILSFRNLSIRSSEKKKGKELSRLLLDSADADFPRAQITAVLGPSGSGKTTSFLAALGHHPYEGEIFLEGREIRKYRRKELYRKMGVVFQNPANQFITQNVEEEICASLRVWDRKASDEACRAKADELLRSYGLERFRRYSPYMLSQGQQRRLAVLSVLAGGQQILLLDEPTYGQDESSTSSIMRQLRARMEEEGLTVIFITHDRELAFVWADRIYEFREKKLVELHVQEAECES